MCHVAGQPDEREPGRAHAGFHHRLHVYSGVGSFRHPILSGAHCLLFSSLARLLACFDCSAPRLLGSSLARLLACSPPRLLGSVDCSHPPGEASPTADISLALPLLPYAPADISLASRVYGTWQRFPLFFLFLLTTSFSFRFFLPFPFPLPSTSASIGTSITISSSTRSTGNRHKCDRHKPSTHTIVTTATGEPLLPLLPLLPGVPCAPSAPSILSDAAPADAAPLSPSSSAFPHLLSQVSLPPPHATARSAYGSSTGTKRSSSSSRCRKVAPAPSPTIRRSMLSLAALTTARCESLTSRGE